MSLVMAVPHALSMSNFSDAQTLLVSALSFILVCFQLLFICLTNWCRFPVRSYSACNCCSLGLSFEASRGLLLEDIYSE